LRRIEGIGPKISALLQAAGLTTFSQVAVSDADSLRQVLRAGGIRMANPTTWPEQAQLAAAGEWEALAALQDRLTGGRRT
jgi:predicted flap endonuclease-1-like 5' DNA nuclease